MLTSSGASSQSASCVFVAKQHDNKLCFLRLSPAFTSPDFFFVCPVQTTDFFVQAGPKKVSEFYFCGVFPVTTLYNNFGTLLLQ